ncbi:hypothetical protein I0C86_41340 [Plantactinospora sp. S1510]|uniref:Uncharacterized protein n=1 Tax=Plantactinospora alkalitolerans TaxID=2789879 RepID=A0ABS0H9Z8_9ACTN|nr:hypothetical protein [Plantactinospora alkalitolerans]MBF9135298.1 hypothetical protein [Plantactinospora alkalitolerans]
MPGSPQHVVLAADTVRTVTLDQDYYEVEVAMIADPATLWFRADGQAPVAMGDGTHVLPAALSFLSLRPGSSGPTVVKLLSAGTPTVSVRGVPR